MRILKSAQKMHVLSVIYNIYGLAISIMFRSALLWAIYHIKSKKKKKQHFRHVSCLEQQHICLDSLAKFWQSNYKRKIKLFKMEEVKCVKIQRSQCAKKCVVISKILACDQCVVVMAKGDNSSFFFFKRWGGYGATLGGDYSTLWAHFILEPDLKFITLPVLRIF